MPAESVSKRQALRVVHLVPTYYVQKLDASLVIGVNRLESRQQIAIDSDPGLVSKTILSALG